MSAAKTHKQPESSFALFTKSKEMVQRNLKLFIIVYLLPLFLTILDMGSKQRMNEKKQLFEASNPFVNFPTSAIVSIIGLGVILLIVGLVLAVLYQAFITSLEFEAAKGKTVKAAHIWDMTKKYALRLLGFGIVYGLMIVLGIALLIVPGLIVIRRYFLTPYAIIDKDMSIGDAMRYSADISKPHSGYVWGVIGVLILISLVGIVPVVGGLLSLVLGMFYSVAPALRYNELKHLA
jgi:uncharacterized membrane protein